MLQSNLFFVCLQQYCILKFKFKIPIVPETLRGKVHTCDNLHTELFEFPNVKT